LVRALKAAKAANVKVSIEIETGKMTVRIDDDLAVKPDNKSNPWDEVYAQNPKRTT
jgi:hypothetical protein